METELADLKAYHQPYYVIAAVDLVLWPLLLILGARFLTRPLFSLASRVRFRSRVMERVWGDDSWAPTVVFALLYFGVFAVLTIPLEWWTWAHERAFGMSVESPGSFAFDSLKAHVALVIAVSALAFGLFGIARRTPKWWWLVGIATSLLLVVSVALDPYKAALYVDQEPLPAGPLRTQLTDVLARAQVPFGEIVVVNTSKKTVRVQAAFAGTGPTRTILLTDTLLSSMTESEIVAAVAHEAGHVSESKWPGRIFTPLCVVALLFFIEVLFRRSAARGWFGITARADVRVLPLVLLTFDLLMSAAAPISGAFSRERELAADRFAISLTGDRASLSSLLTKLGQINKTDPDPPRWYVLSGVSHPTIRERVERIEAAP
ncbi:MAG: M48 family metalloprotease [Archangium sp.]